MTWLDDQRDDRSDKRVDEQQVRNRHVYARLGIVVALAVFMASVMPPALVAPALSSLLSFFAIASGLVAAFTSERLFADHFTRWDQGAVLMALSLLAGFFIDPDAMQAALESAR